MLRRCSVAIGTFARTAATLLAPAGPDGCDGQLWRPQKFERRRILPQPGQLPTSRPPGRAPSAS
eukprot:11245739-Alexandrium_andersonii.AAC.1